MLAEHISSANKDILDELFAGYYRSAGKSPVTSSYWKEYGSRNSVEISGERITVDVHGLGTFVRPSLLRRLKHSVPSLLSKRLLRSFAVDKEIESRGYEVAGKQNRLPIFSEIKQIIICDILKKRGILGQSRVIAVIGDGYGFMTSLLKLAAPQAKVICVNLGKMLLFDALYASKVFPDAKMSLLRGGGDYDKAVKEHPVVFVEAEKYEMLFGREIDLFINIASMQEMDPGVIKTYFDIIRSGAGKRYLYLCNREEKVLPDGTVIRFDEYPWSSEDEIIFDELCPFNQKYPVSTPPFWKPFDGPIRHRLTKMSGKLQQRIDG